MKGEGRSPNWIPATATAAAVSFPATSMCSAAVKERRGRAMGKTLGGEWIRMRRYFHRASACASQPRHYFGSSLLHVGHAHSWSARDSFSRSANVFSEGARTAPDGPDAFCVGFPDT
jgi:hypothetical protein